MPHSFISMGALSPAAYAASERVVADVASVLKYWGSDQRVSGLTDGGQT